ncbi:putative phage tail protein [Brevibacillus fluminis]|uniref:putative phage tail protein n=1 Tax=Brevibacillus fluminis TaxID=511487 RepID=UPI003F8AEA80
MFNLREQLASTGLYSESDPISRGELKAYERQLNDLLAWQQQMKREMALDTTEMLIERWEKIYDVIPSQTASIRDRQIDLLVKRQAKGVLTQAKIISVAKNFGYTAKVIKHFRPFCYQVDIQERKFDVTKLEAFLLKAEPGHQTHIFSHTEPAESIMISASSRSFVVDYPLCGMFYPEDEAEGRIFRETVAIASAARANVIAYPITNDFYPTPEV